MNVRVVAAIAVALLLVDRTGPGAALLAVAAFAALNAAAALVENSRRLRCGARDGLLGTCSAVVEHGKPRCPRHSGLPRRIF